MKASRLHLKYLLASAMFLAIAIVLPFLTGQIKELGNALCPMHIPAMLCGFLCGPYYGAVVGFIAPLLRSMLFGMPMIIPSGIAMAFELATYGFLTGMLYKVLPKKKTSIYVILIIAMVVGRIVSIAVRLALYGLNAAPFAWAAVFATTFTNTMLGMAIQVVLIPILVIAVKDYH